MNPAHLTDGSFLKKSDDLSIEKVGGFSRDGGVARCNPLLKGTLDLGRFVAIPDNINVTLTSANLPITILTVSQSATQLQ